MRPVGTAPCPKEACIVQSSVNMRESVCMSVCVCQREREREREIKRERETVVLCINI